MYTFDSRVRYSECDQSGHLSLPALVNYLQDCSTFQSVDLGRGVAAMTDEHLMWVLATWRIEVARRPMLGERVRVGTWCYEMTRSHALRCFFIEDERGEKVVRADSQWLVFDAARGHATRVPTDQEVYVERDRPRLEMGPLDRRMRAEGHGATLPAITVGMRHIDTNHHVNNAQYVELACEVLEDAGHALDAVMCVEVAYRRMARLGDVVVPALRERTDGWDVDLADVDGTTYALVRLLTEEGDRDA